MYAHVRRNGSDAGGKQIAGVRIERSRAALACRRLRQVVLVAHAVVDRQLRIGMPRVLHEEEGARLAQARVITASSEVTRKLVWEADQKTGKR